MEVDRRYTVAMEDSVREGELVQVDASASLLTSTDSYGCFVANVDARGEEEEEEEEAIVEKVIQELDEKIDQTQLTDSAMELLRLVPDGYLPLPHQVGGHRHIDGKLGALLTHTLTHTHTSNAPCKGCAFVVCREFASVGLLISKPHAELTPHTWHTPSKHTLHRLPEEEGQARPPLQAPAGGQQRTQGSGVL